MKKTVAILCAAGFCITAVAAEISSPDGSLTLNVDVDGQGVPYYALDYKGRPLVEKSRLGLVADEGDFGQGFHIVSADTLTVDR